MTNQVWGQGPFENPKMNLKKINKRIIIGTLGLIAFLAVVGGSSATGSGNRYSGNDSGSVESSSPDRSSTAFIMCKDSVRAKLKAPSTATFRNFYEADGEVRAWGTGYGPYTIISTVS